MCNPGTDKEWKSIEDIAYACEQRDGCGGSAHLRCGKDRRLTDNRDWSLFEAKRNFDSFAGELKMQLLFRKLQGNALLTMLLSKSDEFKCAFATEQGLEIFSVRFFTHDAQVLST